MRHRLAFAALILVTAIGGVAVSADSSELSVEQRLRALEAKVVDLERRLEAKEAAPAVVATPVAAPAAVAAPTSAVAPRVSATPAPATIDSPPSQAPAQWHALKRGMSWSQVIGVLGKPGKKRVGTMSEVWYYPDSNGGSVEFDRDGRVSGWSEP